MDAAIRSGTAVAITAVLANGIDINAEIGLGVTPLWMAANPRVPIDILRVCLRIRTLSEAQPSAVPLCLLFLDSHRFRLHIRYRHC